MLNKTYRKCLLFFTSIAFCLSFSACSKFDQGFIYGQWNGICELKSDVSFSGKNPEEPEASIYFKQEITYTFNSDGTFIKEIKQDFSRIEVLDEEVSIPSDEQLKAMLSMETTFAGNYSVSKDSITFLNKTVKTENTELSFEEYSYSNPTVGEEQASEDYTFNNNKLVISKITCTKK